LGADRRIQTLSAIRSPSSPSRFLVLTLHCLNLGSFHTRPRVKALGDTASESDQAPQMYNSLPAEVWRQIFATAVRPRVHAQRVQKIGDDDDDPFNLANPQYLRGSLKTTLALCLVSKSFNSLATEFLYKCIRFTCLDHLNSAIQHSTDGGVNNFWWTKVLELRLWYTMDSSSASVTHLRLVVFAAPVVVTDVDFNKVKTVYRSLPRSVRAIRFGADSLPPSQLISTTALDNICQISIESGTMMPASALTLPRLTYFRARDEFAPTNLIFPALRIVCLVAWWRKKELESSPLGLPAVIIVFVLGQFDYCTKYLD